jgi:hypothetical protein
MRTLEDSIKMDLKYIGLCTNSTGSGQCPVADFCNEPSGAIKEGKCFDMLCKYQLFQKLFRTLNQLTNSDLIPPVRVVTRGCISVVIKTFLTTWVYFCSPWANLILF